jgi:hypothetical protein
MYHKELLGPGRPHLVEYREISSWWARAPAPPSQGQENL